MCADKSPEALLGTRRDGRKADIWGAGALLPPLPCIVFSSPVTGLVLYEMLTKRFVYERSGTLAGRVLKRGQVEVQRILNEVPKTYSSGLKRLLGKMLHVDPDMRCVRVCLCLFHHFTILWCTDLQRRTYYVHVCSKGSIDPFPQQSRNCVR